MVYNQTWQAVKINTMDTKDKLLSDLKASKGAWISGELLSRKLSVSRAAISKHVSKLRQVGYDIESVPNKGYSLKNVSDLLLAEEIRDGLETKIFGKKEIIYFTETDSTNTKAKEFASKGAPEGTLVVAEKQTMGRGRKGRSWFSPESDNVYASIILRPKIPPSEAPVITLLSAVATAEALISLTDLKPRIKWPNDILINGKKIAGILTEISMEMDAVDFIVVGIGLNINTKKEDFSREIKRLATSVFIETKKRFSRAKILGEYLKWYETYYDIFKEKGFKPVSSRWKELTDIIGKRITVDMISKKYVGRVVDVDDEGVLILKDDKGKLHRIYSGDITVM